MSKVFWFNLCFILMVYIIGSCSSKEPTTFVNRAQVTSTPSVADTIICTADSCYGSYSGPEFVAGSDVAHQFSNTMSGRVGNHLKELYKDGIYSMVELDQIRMTTQGMGSGHVVYYLSIPFKRVSTQCEAYTSFDHCGGWRHAPAISARKKQLHKALLPGDTLMISPLLKTPEGLEEYWIQWRNKIMQKECSN